MLRCRVRHSFPSRQPTATEATSASAEKILLLLCNFSACNDYQEEVGLPLRDRERAHVADDRAIAILVRHTKSSTPTSHSSTIAKEIRLATIRFTLCKLCLCFEGELREYVMRTMQSGFKCRPC